MRALSASLLLLFACWPGASLGSPPETPASAAPDRAALIDRLAALEFEHAIVTQSPEAYYLVIDLADARVDLKSGARLLRSAEVLRVAQRPGGPTGTVRCTYVGALPPVTPEPGAEGLRLGGQRLPMDFAGRLTEGPRHASRLCFSQGLILQPADAVCPEGAVCVGLAGPDIKALGSALQPGASAIVVPTAPHVVPTAQRVVPGAPLPESSER